MDVDLTSFMTKEEPESAIKTPLPEPKKATKATKTAPEPINPLEADQRTALLDRVKAYFAVFPDKLKDLQPKTLDKLSDDELQHLNEKIALRMGTKSGVEGFAAMVPPVIKVAEEFISTITPLKIQGTHAVCLNPEMQDLIKCAIIDMGFSGIRMTPCQRVMGSIIITAARQHSINSDIEKLSDEQKEKLASAVVAAQSNTDPVDPKYADL